MSKTLYIPAPPDSETVGTPSGLVIVTAKLRLTLEDGTEPVEVELTGAANAGEPVKCWQVSVYDDLPALVHLFQAVEKMQGKREALRWRLSANWNALPSLHIVAFPLTMAEKTFLGQI